MSRLSTKGRVRLTYIAISTYTTYRYIDKHKPKDSTRSNSGRTFMTYVPEEIVYSISPCNFTTYQPLCIAIANLRVGMGISLKYVINVTTSALLLEKILFLISVSMDLFKAEIEGHNRSNTFLYNKQVQSHLYGKLCRREDDAVAVFKKIVLKHRR